MELSGEQGNQNEIPKITRLIIEKDVEGRAINQSNMAEVTIKGISVSRNEFNQGYDYYNLVDLSRTKKISVTLREKDEEKEVELPSDMLRRMAEYLARKSQMKEKFDCASFAHAVNGVQYAFSEYHPEKWIETAFDNVMNAGDTIIIADASTSGRKIYTHFAIYLGDGLYISKFGSMGNLIVTDIDSLKKLFDGDTAYKLKPRKEFIEPLPDER